MIEPHPGASFSEYQRTGDITLRAARTWIDANAAAPFFYFFHIYEPHTPWEPTYDADVAASDAIVGRFLDHLRQSGVYDKSTIVLLSDHGEGLGDHGEDEHGVFLYREAIQVPLMLKLPKGAAGPVRVGWGVAGPGGGVVGGRGSQGWGHGVGTGAGAPLPGCALT